MSRNDWIGIGVNLVLGGVCYLIGGTGVAILAIGAGVIILVILHQRGIEQNQDPLISDVLRRIAREQPVKTSTENSSGISGAKIEHTPVEGMFRAKTEIAVQARVNRPKLFLEYSALVAATYGMTFSGLSLKNDGVSAAHNIRLLPERYHGFTLHMVNPVAPIEKGSPYPLEVKFCKVDGKGTLFPRGGPHTDQVLNLMKALSRLGQDFFEVMICYEDFEQGEWTSCTRIRYDSLFERVSTELC